MTHAPRRSRFGAVAVVLLLLGIVLAALSRVASGTERHAYSAGAVPPASARVTAGHTYLLSLPGGVQTLQEHGPAPAGLRCEWSANGSAAQTLAMQLYGPDSKATDAIGTFLAPVTGAIHVDCVGWGAVFIDDADDATVDIAGLLLVLCIVAFTLGGTLGLSALRCRTARSRTTGRSVGEAGSSVGPPGNDDEIERLVHFVHVRSENGEISGADGDDVAP